MLTPEQLQWLQEMTIQAKAAGHLFPTMAACEAALESNYGKSQLAANDNNLFGMKQHQHPLYGTVNLPTKEFVDPDGAGPQPGQWVVVDAKFVEYPDAETCFFDRMATLRRLRQVYSHYANALTAADATTYIVEVSKTWSTDPLRAAKVLGIWKQLTGATGNTA